MYRILTQYNITTKPASDNLEFHFYPSDTLKNKLRFCCLAVFTNRFDGVLVEGTRIATLICFFRLFFPRQVKVFVNSPFLDYPPTGFIDRLKFRIVDSSIFRYLVVGSSEIEAYKKFWGVKSKKLFHHPFKVNSAELLDSLSCSQGSFIHAGGDSLRDYPTLFLAIKGTGIPTEVFTTLKFEKSIVPEEVVLLRRSKDEREFYQSMADAFVCVFPTEAGHLRVGAQSCYLCAMYLKKVVIVSAGPGVDDFIKDGYNGFIVPPGDPKALQEKIMFVKNNYESLAPMRAAAYETVRDHTHDNYMQRMFRYIEQELKNEI